MEELKSLKTQLQRFEKQKRTGIEQSLGKGLIFFFSEDEFGYHNNFRILSNKSRILS